MTGWSALAMPLFCMPAYLPVTAATVNYAGVVFVGFVAISAAWYFVWGRKNYRGPPTETVAVEHPHQSPDSDDVMATKKD